jgi:hypothetical protein
VAFGESGAACWLPVEWMWVGMFTRFCSVYGSGKAVSGKRFAAAREKKQAKVCSAWRK